MMGFRLHVLTLFPEAFEGFLSSSLIGKARTRGLLEVELVDIRDFASGAHRSVDDAPYGGGAGMVMMIEPLVQALESVEVERSVALTPQGGRLTQRELERFSKLESMAIVCGRYEGFDERFRGFVDEEISIGDFVLNGGEVGAMVLIDGIARLLPGVLGNPASLEHESHAAGLLEYPQYTRPPVFRGLAVPEILVSGDHGAIARWRHAEALKRTRARRPDLWREYPIGPKERKLLDEEE